MPNYDLGTARGRIRVDSDTRGAKLADRALQAFEKTVRALSGRMSAFEQHMNRMESELNAAAREFEQTGRAAHGYERGVRDADRSTRQFSNGILDLQHRLKGLHNTTEKLLPPSLLLAKVWREFRGTNGGLFGFTQAVHRAGGSAAILTHLTSSFIGLGAAVNSLTGRRRQLVQFAGGFRTFTFLAGTLGGLAAKMGLFEKTIGKVLNKLAADTIGGDLALKGFHDRVNNLSRPVRSLVNNLDRASLGVIQLIGGVALMQRSWTALTSRFGAFNRLFQRFPMLATALATALLGIPAALQAGGRALVWFSNLLLAAVDAGKQLAGGFLALPGAIAVAVTAVQSLKVIMTGFKDLFADVFKAKTPEELATAVGELAPEFRDLGKAVGEASLKLKDIQKQMMLVFGQGGAEQVKALTAGFGPVLESAGNQLAVAWRNAKDQVVGFLGESQTVTDMNTIFSRTAQIINSLSENIKPAAEGMRDIAVVGTDFVRELTAQLPGVVGSFSEWARVNRENGNLMRWMREAWSGAIDLKNGIIDAGKAVWTLLTLFADRSGDNALQRFADSMERFNNAVQKSAASGMLREIGDAVRGMGTDKIASFIDLLKDLAPTLKQVIDFAKDFTEAFGQSFELGLRIAAEVLEHFLDLLNEFGGGHVLGWIIGLAAAFKLVAAAIGPIRNMIQMLIGAFTALKGMQNIVLALGYGLENFGKRGKKASDAVVSLGDKLAGLGAKAGVALAGITLLLMGAMNGQAAFKEFDKAVADSAVNMAKWKDSLKDAFIADRGLVGKNVTDQVSAGLETMQSDAEGVASAMPGVMDHIEDFWNALSGTGDKTFNQGVNPFESFESNEINKLQEDAAKAEGIVNKFKELQGKGIDLTAVVTGDQGQFDKFVTELDKAAGASGDVAAKLREARAEVMGMRDAFAQFGPGPAQLAAGIQQIADASGDSSAKLAGLKLALEGLGLLKTTEYEAAFAYAEAIRGLGTAALEAADQNASFTDILDATGQKLNTNSVNAQNLFNVLQPLGERFMAAASQGKNAGQMWADLQPELQRVADAFRLPLPVIQQLAGQVGALPDVVPILVQLEGKDELTRDMAQLLVFAKANLGKGMGVPIFVENPQALETEVERIYGDILDQTAGGVKLKVNVDPAGLGPLQQFLASKGIQLPGGPAPVAPATMPVAPGAPPAGAPPPPAGPPPNVAPPPADQAALDEANRTIGDMKRQIDELNNKPAKIQIDTATLSEVKTKLEEVQRVFNDGKIQFEIIAKGYDETIHVVNEVKKSVTQLIEETNKIAPAFTTAFSQVQGVLANAQTQMKDSGHKMMTDLAQGIRDGAAEVLSAATDSATVVAEVLVHRSPPKKGPLAGRNWLGYSGETMANDFAAGVVRGYTVAGKAADGLASQFGGLPYKSGEFQVTPILQQLRTLSQFVSNFKGVADRISGVFMDAVKFMSDPLGKGTFFGQSTGAALGFKVDPKAREEARRAKEDENFSAIGVTHGGTGKAPGPTEITGEVTVAGADWDAIAQKESGGVWDLPHGDRDSTGGLQIRQGTWEDFGGLDIAPQPYMASKEEQIRIAEKILAKQGPNAWAGGKNFVPAKSGQTSGGRPVRRSDLKVTGAKGLDPEAQRLIDVIAKEFPEITNIGGVRSDPLPDHPSGRGLDIMTGDDMELGDRLNEFLRANADTLNLHSTIWRDTWKDMAGNSSEVAGHMDHIHARTLENTGNVGDVGALSYDTEANTAESVDQQKAILDQLRSSNAKLDEQIRVGENPNSTDEQVASSLQMISTEIDKQSLNDTPAGRANVQALEGIKSQIAGDRGMVEAGNPLDQAAGIMSGMSSIAGSAIEVFNAWIESVQATKNLTDMAIRYPSNTEDIMQMIDDFQKFIELGAAVAGAVSAVAGAAGSMTGGMDMGITSAVGQVAGMVQAALEAINAGIDIAQEAWHIFGSYFGEFLGILVGGPGGPLGGNVKFLLDEAAGQLYAYGQDNPMDKRGHNVPGQIKAPEYTQGIGQVNVFGGPGSDPRDNTRDMMFQVRAAGFAGATNG